MDTFLSAFRFSCYFAFATVCGQAAAERPGPSSSLLPMDSHRVLVQGDANSGQDPAPVRRAYCTDTGNMLIGGRWCATGVRAFKDRNQIGRRFLLTPDDPRASTGQQYMVWHDCGTESFRVLARFPSHLRARDRWMELQARDGDDRAKGLRDIGNWACELQFSGH